MSNDSNNGDFHALVIDDEKQLREFVSTVLRDEGWKVSQSASAEDAFGRLHEAHWSVVFCDVILGGANGYSVLRHFKEKMPEAKVVLMTGHGSAAGALDATAFGAYDYLLKPFGPEELQSLSRALRNQLTERPQRSSPTRRVAAYNSDIELVGRSQAFIEGMDAVKSVGGTRPHAVADQSAHDDWVPLSEIEGRYVARVLEHTRGNKQAAARVLEIDRKTLDRMIKRHHIDAHNPRGHRVKASGGGA